MRKLFLLEDDLSLISGLTFAFKKQGFALDTARTLAEAEVLWSDRKYDLLVLDVSLPDGSGFDFCQKVRRTSNVPILFLTASPCKCVQRRRTRTGIGQHHRPAVAGTGVQKRNLAGTDRRRVQAALLLYAASECRAIQGTNSGCTVGLRWGLH